MIISTTPRKISKEVLKFSKELTGNKPLFVENTPTANAIKQECFDNVEKLINKVGKGSIQYGWIIWEVAKIKLETEFHSVYKTETGELQDITPTNDNEKKILFLPDFKQKYYGRIIPNRFFALDKSKLVMEMIGLQQKLNNLKSKVFNQEIRTDDQNYIQYEQISIEINYKLGKFYDYVISKRGNNDTCICGSGKKFKNCCKS